MKETVNTCEFDAYMLPWLQNHVHASHQSCWSGVRFIDIHDQARIREFVLTWVGAKLKLQVEAASVQNFCRSKCTQGDLHEKLWEYCCACVRDRQSCSLSVVSAGVHTCAALVKEYIWEEPLEILGPLCSNCGQSDPNLIFVLFPLTWISVCRLYLTWVWTDQ